MSGDYSRKTFHPKRDFSGVLMQQGRVQLDADWNELIEIVDRRFRAETIDIIGRGTVPNETPHGFEIGIDANNNLTIGCGRIYVDGLRAENHGKPPLQFDPVLAEQEGTVAVPYNEQPYFPNPAPAPAEGGPYLVYLDVWQREVTYLEVPQLIEKAVGVDTTTRLQTVWQVRVLANVGANVTCDTEIQAWDDLIKPSDGRLSTDAVGVASVDDPCVIPPSGGYRGLENRLYRVEIHDGGAAGAGGTATFKWSRDNASIATSVTAIPALDKLIVARVGRDNTLRFSVGDWIEITDDWLEFAQEPGLMCQIKDVVDATLTITLTNPLPAGKFWTDAQGNTDPTRHTRIKLWNQQGKVTDTNGNLLVDLNAPGSAHPGVIPVPSSGTSIILEDGVQITFETPANGVYRVGDFWCFAARTADASVEKLVKAPPRGIHHHFCRLAIVTFPNPPTDCRHLWPPPFGEAGCDCSVCVTEKSHNGGTLTLQSAVNQVQATGGGKICLGPGIYLINSPVIIANGHNIEISGHGMPSLVASGLLTSQQPIFKIDSCLDINIEDIAFEGPVGVVGVVGVTISNSHSTRIKRCLFTGDVDGGSSPMSLGIGFSGFVSNVQVHDCFFNNVQIGTGGPTTETFIHHLSIQNNEMVCTTAGFSFDSPTNLSDKFVFADNLVTAPIGFQFSGQGLDIAIERNSFTLTAGAGNTANAAIVCAGNQVRISNNQILGARLGNQGTDGIVLGGGVMKGIQVTSNHVEGLAGHGILVKERRTTLQEAVISQNQLLSLGGAGIFMEQVGASAVDLNITSNAISSVGLTSGVDPFMAGILLQATMENVNVNENTIEQVGPNPNGNSRGGIILANLVKDFRAAGNRIVDVGPPSNVQPSVGISVFGAIGRVDISDNEVRRAKDPPSSKDTSQFWAVLIGAVVGDLAIRGNILESFGSEPTVSVVSVVGSVGSVVASGPSCVFTDNQCFLENVVSISGTLSTVVVRLGYDDNSNAGAIMASNNFVFTPLPPSVLVPTVMILNPKDKVKTLTVLGNIISGGISVSGFPLAPPWDKLNAWNV